MRVLLKRSYCSYCRNWKGVVEKINLRLPPRKKIRIVDTTLYDKYGIVTDNVINEIKWEGTPHLHIDGVDYTGALSRWSVEAWLVGFLKGLDEL